MADLLPTLSSDDDDDEKGKYYDEDDEPEEEEEIDVEFGGILGEDGGLPSNLLLGGQQGLSYQTALDKIEESHGLSSQNGPARMDIASLIAAKRKSLKKGIPHASKATQIEGEDNDDEEETKDHESDHDENEDVSMSSDGDEKDDEGDDDGSTSEDGGSDDNKEGDSDDDDDDNDDDDDDDDDDDENDEVDDANHDMAEDVLKTRIGDDEDDKDEEDDVDDSDKDDESKREAEKASKFFETQSAPKSTDDDVEVFAQLTLSRPLLRGVAAMGFVKPTPIQSSVIPVALAGRDICASAVTGSGKTAAFLLPILERLLYRSPGRIKALILTPTRELAAQCLGMLATLSQFTKLSSTLIVGGSKNMNAQMAELRAQPQVVVATPGRLLDHITNSAGVSLEDLELLVLDEADRLLDLGFADEVNEIIKACPSERQTLLFSATMNTKVDDLIQLSLKRPVRVRISDKQSSQNSKDLEVAPRLEQEFIRVRSGNEGVCREAMLLALLTRTFTNQTIVFFDTKVKAHRMMILCGLCGIQCAELHGNLTQSQRLEALEQFRKGEVDILLATDLAARGLDISRVDAVINFEMPNQVETYIHRIGRTARAGRGGKSCTLIGEGRRHLMKEIIKDASDRKKIADTIATSSRTQSPVIRSRSIPAAVISHFVNKIETLEEHVQEVLQAEAVARMDRLAEMEATRAQNIIEHSDEIKARPQREWFASIKEKKMTKEAAAEKARLIKEKVGTGSHRMTRKKRRAREAMEMFEGGGGDDDDGTPAVPKLPSLKKAAREHKREQQESKNAKLTKSIHDEDVERAARKRKGRVGQDSLGDSSLFSEEKIAYAAKKKKTNNEERQQSTFNFRGYDPLKDGKKKGKAQSHHKFKSKSKYKRR